MRTIPSACTVRHLVVVPSQIHFLRFILEAYEGIGLVTTIDPKLGWVRLSIAPGCEADIEQILTAEQPRLQWRSITPDEPPGTGIP